eukprot:178723-Alexandrium_andersonii.AAC.1
MPALRTPSSGPGWGRQFRLAPLHQHLGWHTSWPRTSGSSSGSRTRPRTSSSPSSSSPWTSASTPSSACQLVRSGRPMPALRTPSSGPGWGRQFRLAPLHQHLGWHPPWAWASGSPSGPSSGTSASASSGACKPSRSGASKTPLP